MAEEARELAPPALREQIRAAVEMSDGSRPWMSHFRSRVATAGLAALLVVSGLAAMFVFRDGSGQPEPIAAAVASYRSHRVPVTGPPAHHAPDLSSVGLRMDVGSRIDLGGLMSDVFTYRAEEGTVFLFLGNEQFPEAVGARERSEPVLGWEATMNGVALVCGDSPVSYLLLSDDPILLSRAEQAFRTQHVPLDA